MFKFGNRATQFETVFFDVLTVSRKTRKTFKRLFKQRVRILELVQRCHSDIFEPKELNITMHCYEEFIKELGDYGVIVFIKDNPIAMIACSNTHEVLRVHVDEVQGHPMLKSALDGYIKLLKESKKDKTLHRCLTESKFFLEHPDTYSATTKPLTEDPADLPGPC